LVERTRTAAAAWDAAIDPCATGFRVPSIIELISIANPATERVDQVFDSAANGTGVGSWSSSPVAQHPDSAWHFYGGYGSTYPLPKRTSYGALCVKGGEVNPLPHYAVTSIDAIAAVRDHGRARHDSENVARISRGIRVWIREHVQCGQSRLRALRARGP